MKVKQSLKEEPGADTHQTVIKKEWDVKELSEEDRARRSRRRERNKVAATKCRYKKREETTGLMRESEVVEALNSSLKQELSRLESEEQQLSLILYEHSQSQTCSHRKRRRNDSGGNYQIHDTVFKVPDNPPYQTPSGTTKEELYCSNMGGDHFNSVSSALSFVLFNTG